VWKNKEMSYLVFTKEQIEKKCSLSLFDLDERRRALILHTINKKNKGLLGKIRKKFGWLYDEVKAQKYLLNNDRWKGDYYREILCRMNILNGLIEYSNVGAIALNKEEYEALMNEGWLFVYNNF